MVIPEQVEGVPSLTYRLICPLDNLSFLILFNQVIGDLLKSLEYQEKILKGLIVVSISTQIYEELVLLLKEDEWCIESGISCIDLIELHMPIVLVIHISLEGAWNSLLVLHNASLDIRQEAPHFALVLGLVVKDRMYTYVDSPPILTELNWSPLLYSILFLYFVFHYLLNDLIVLVEEFIEGERVIALLTYRQLYMLIVWSYYTTSVYTCEVVFLCQMRWI